jgi:ABC-type transport system substrate-binding protein
VFTTRQVPGGPKIDAAAIEKEKSVQLVLKYHPNRFPLWTKAKYGGDVKSAAATSDPTLNALTVATRRNYHYGRLLSYDQGLCSWVGRDADFSVCKGEYALNAFVAIVPGIIQRWEQPDPVTYLLHVRKGALWSAVPPMNRVDREITADDVKWFLDIMQAKSVYRDSFVEVKSTEALDRYTVKVITVAPLPDFLRNIAQTGIGFFPKECYEAPDCLGKKLVTAGPWIMKEFVPRQKVIFEKNPEFYLKGLPYIDRWTFLFIADQASLQSAFITGQVMNFRAFKEEEVMSVAARVPGAKLELNYSAASGYAMRPKLEGPFADVRVRQALMLALDLRVLWELSTGGLGVVPTETGRDIFAFGKTFFLTTDLAGQWYQYNPERAKKLLAEAGFPDGFKTKVTLGGAASGQGYEQLLGVQSLWKKNLNVDLTIVSVDTTAGTAALTGKKWEGLHASIGAGGWSDGSTGFLTHLKGSPFNYQDIDDPLINELYEKARREMDPIKRIALVWQFEQYEMDRVYIFRLNHVWPWDLVQASEINAAAHIWDFWYSLGVAWLSMQDPDKVRK